MPQPNLPNIFRFGDKLADWNALNPLDEACILVSESEGGKCDLTVC